MYEDDERNEEMSFDGERKASTDMAMLVDIDGSEVWLPLSETEIEKTGGKFSSAVRVTIPRWLAEQKDLA
jgi:predicted DNA-binding ribbon-helix-helix protein